MRAKASQREPKKLSESHRGSQKGPKRASKIKRESHRESTSESRRESQREPRTNVLDALTAKENENLREVFHPIFH